MVSACALKFTLFGYPLRSSFSPQIHQTFAAQFGLKIEYDLTAAAPENFQTAWLDFFSNGGRGANITAPYKELVYSQLTNLTPNAALARAVNTVVVQSDGSLLGENTDGIGLIRDFAHKNINVTNREILILGAGGAVRGILPSLLKLHSKKITIVNRDLKKAEILINDFATLGNIDLISYTQSRAIYADVIINATSSLDPGNFGRFASSAGMTGFRDSGTTYYDLNYTPTSNFLQTAKKSGAQQVFNGLGMLIEQAAASFALWQRLDPDTTAVRAFYSQRYTPEYRYTEAH